MSADSRSGGSRKPRSWEEADAGVRLGEYFAGGFYCGSADGGGIVSRTGLAQPTRSDAQANARDGARLAGGGVRIEESLSREPGGAAALRPAEPAIKAAGPPRTSDPSPKVAKQTEVAMAGLPTLEAGNNGFAQAPHIHIGISRARRSRRSSGLQGRWRGCSGGARWNSTVTRVSHQRGMGGSNGWQPEWDRFVSALKLIESGMFSDALGRDKPVHWCTYLAE